jgi:hypothetical protein
LIQAAQFLQPKISGKDIWKPDPCPQDRGVGNKQGDCRVKSVRKGSAQTSRCCSIIGRATMGRCRTHGLHWLNRVGLAGWRETSNPLAISSWRWNLLISNELKTRSPTKQAWRP